MLWQDGSVETNMPARGFTPFEPLDDHEFLPHDFVVECDAEEEEKGAGELGFKLRG